MINLFREMQRLNPDPVLFSGEVTLTHADGTVTVELPGGGLLKARGGSDIGDQVFVLGGVVQGPAPDLTPMVIDV